MGINKAAEDGSVVVDGTGEGAPPMLGTDTSTATEPRGAPTDRFMPNAEEESTGIATGTGTG